MSDLNKGILIPDAMSHGKRAPLLALTSVRFFAAFYIVSMHCDLPLDRMPILLSHFLSSGYTAVTLFFALSGFILAYNYPQLASRREFWISRFARIYPVYLLALLISLGLATLNPELRHEHGLGVAAILSTLLMQSWFPPFAMMINSVGWTLSVEAFFYASFPLLNRFCRRPTRPAAGIFFAVYLGLALVPVALNQMGMAAGSELAGLMEDSLPIFRIGTFLLGMLAGALYARKPAHFAGLLPVSLVLTFLLLLWPPQDVFRPLKTALLSCCFSAVLFALAKVQTGPLVNRWLLLGGEISYSLYLLQFIVFRIGRASVLHFYPGASVNNAVFIPALLGISYLSFRYVEIPARRLIRRISLGPRAASRA